MGLPITTPEATDMTARDEAVIWARATPCLMGASTVLFPVLSVLVKVTIVPSGTAFPEQSRTGSVSTTMPLAVRWTLMRRLQGSDATCRTTRRTLMSPAEAISWTVPATLPDLMRNHATPSFVGREWDSRSLPSAVNLKLIVKGARIRLWNLSKGKTVPLMALSAWTGTRDG